MERTSPASAAASPYSAAYYDATTAGSLRSAEIIVPIVMSVLAPTSVCDVGCGSGAWLVPFAACGCRVCGMDGPWVADSLIIDHRAFRAVDLRQPIPTSDRFDLALCLEVAEHLPVEYASVLVQSLTDLAPAVLFSAAIPGQGGADHVNEQPASFWRELFGRHRFICLDPIRRHVWKNHLVQSWYRFNIRLFVHEEHVASSPTLLDEAAVAERMPGLDAFLAKSFLRPYSMPWIQRRFHERLHRGLDRLRDRA